MFESEMRPRRGHSTVRDPRRTSAVRQNKMHETDLVGKTADNLVKQFHEIAKDWHPIERKALAAKLAILFTCVE